MIASAEAQGYKVITTARELSEVHLEPGQRLLGLFNDGNMSMEWSGDPAIPFPGSGPQRCKEFVRPTNEPALLSMMMKSIRLLENSDPQSPGFFLQVEGAQIDKRAHTAEPCQQIGETIAFDNAIKLALDYAADHPGTLIMITADHGNAEMMIDPATGGPHTAHTTNPVPFIVVNPPAAIANLQDGRLCDVAPTLLDLLGLAKPAAMTGHSLIGAAVEQDAAS